MAIIVDILITKLDRKIWNDAFCWQLVHVFEVLNVFATNFQEPHNTLLYYATLLRVNEAVKFSEFSHFL